MQKNHPILLTCLSKAWGGLEMVAYEFAHELIKRDIPFIFVAFEKSPLTERLRNSGIRVTTINAKDSVFKQGFFLLKLIKRHRIEKVIVQKLSEAKPLLLAKILRERLEIFGFSHMWIDHYKKDFIHRFIYKQFSKIIALTSLQKLNLLDHLPLSENQISVVPNWVFTDRLRKVTKRSYPFTYKEKNKKSILTGIIASRLDPQKGQDLVLEAMEKLQKEGLFFNLLIMGENTKNELDFGSKLQKIIKQKGLQDYVQLAPFSEYILDYIAGSDFLLMPSWQETFGRVLPEAMTLGIPCVASDKGGVPDIILDGKNGFLFKSRDVDDLTRVLRLLLQNPHLLSEAALEGFKESQRFEASRILSQILEIFKIDASPIRKPNDKLYRDHQIEAPTSAGF